MEAVNNLGMPLVTIVTSQREWCVFPNRFYKGKPVNVVKDVQVRSLRQSLFLENVFVSITIIHKLKTLKQRLYIFVNVVL